MKYSTLVLALFLNTVEASKLNAVEATSCPSDSESKLKIVAKALSSDDGLSCGCNTCPCGNAKVEAKSDAKSVKKVVTKAIKKMEEKAEKKEEDKKTIKAIKKVTS